MFVMKNQKSDCGGQRGIQPLKKRRVGHPAYCQIIKKLIEAVWVKEHPEYYLVVK